MKVELNKALDPRTNKTGSKVLLLHYYEVKQGANDRLWQLWFRYQGQIYFADFDYEGYNDGLLNKIRFEIEKYVKLKIYRRYNTQYWSETNLYLDFSDGKLIFRNQSGDYEFEVFKYE